MQHGIAPMQWCHLHTRLGHLKGISQSCLPIRPSVGRIKACAAHAQAAVHDKQQFTTLELTAKAPVAAYVHLPFCKRKCFYCDFPVEAVGLNVAKARTQDRMTAYVDLICAEIRATTTLGQEALQTVSFGGGTPSLIPPHLLERILSTLQQQFGIAPCAELSLEADPGTFDSSRLQAYRALGVNRLSMGVQCFDQELLQTCGRSHSLEDVYTAIEAVKAANFPSWSLDLISGLPKLTLSTWQHSLSEAVAAGPNHVSIYDLQVEQGTPFERWYAGQDSPLPKEPEAVAMFEAAVSTLTAAGYQHYEISNYAQPGHRSRHNQVYWHCQPYYAFGLGAASYARGRRFSRPRGMQDYETWVHSYVASGAGCPAAGMPAESQEDRLLDLIMLQLRLSDGLDLQAVQQQFWPAVVAALAPCIADMMGRGLMQFTSATAPIQSSSACDSTLMMQELLAEGRPCCVRLTDPRGFLLSNDVIAELFAVIEPGMLNTCGNLAA